MKRKKPTLSERLREPKFQIGGLRERLKLEFDDALADALEIAAKIADEDDAPGAAQKIRDLYL